PLTSYGMEKAAGELLLGDFSRREFFDGIAIRLPTIVVRPGRPNTAASSFFSGIIREPLNGEEAICPVDTSVRHWFASPDRAVEYLLRAASLDSAALGGRRALTLPGLSLTIAQMIAALERVAGQQTTALITHRPDPAIAAIVNNWPQNFAPRRALDLGFSPDADFDGIIRAFQRDEGL
ncbi:MAG: D-erythronate dehydrogenase, partial [Alphaproteobacteria bacterium]